MGLFLRWRMDSTNMYNRLTLQEIWYLYGIGARFGTREHPTLDWQIIAYNETLDYLYVQKPQRITDDIIIQDCPVFPNMKMINHTYCVVSYLINGQRIPAHTNLGNVQNFANMIKRLF